MGLSTVASMVRAYWPLSEAAGLRSDVFHGHHAVATNDPGNSAGKIASRAIQCDIVSAQYVQAPHDPLLNVPDGGNGSITLGGWVWLDALTPDAQNFFSKWVIPDLSYSLQHIKTTNVMRLLVSDDGLDTTDLVATTDTMSANTWHFFLAEHDGPNDLITVELDMGGRVTKGYATGVFEGVADVTLGRDENSNNYLGGRLSGCFILEGLMSAADKALVYNGGAGVDLAQYLTRANLYIVARGRRDAS